MVLNPPPGLPPRRSLLFSWLDARRKELIESGELAIDLTKIRGGRGGR